MPQDYTTLSNPKFLYRADLTHPFPEWVVAEPIPKAEEMSKLASQAFADVRNRLLPINNKINAFYSALNIFSDAEAFDEGAFDRVKKACSTYGIDGDVAPYANMFLEEFDKSAGVELVEGHYAIDSEVGGRKVQLLPINDEDDIQQAARELSKMASERRIDIASFVDGCHNIVKRANEMHTHTLPRLIKVYGTPRIADADAASRALEGRENLCKDAALHEQLREIYKGAAGKVEHDPDTAFAEIAAADMLAGLDKVITENKITKNAYDIVYSGPYEFEIDKAASENIFVDEVIIPVEAINNVSDKEAEFKLTKSAYYSFEEFKKNKDAIEMNVALDRWGEKDKKTLLGLAIKYN